MKQRHYFIIAVVCALAGTARAETVTYTLSGNTEKNYPNPGDITCYLTVSASGDEMGTVSTSWNAVTTTSVSISLPGGITLCFGTDKSSMGMAAQSSLMIEGATSNGGEITLSHPPKYIYHVTLMNGSSIVHEGFGQTTSYTWNFQQAKVETITVEYGDYIPIGRATISGVDDSYIYQGSPICPEPVVECFGRTLTKGTDYTVEYLNNNKPGIASVKIDGINLYQGSVTKNFTIIAAATEMVLEAGSHEVTEDAAYTTIRVTGDVTLTIAEGVTLSASNGITIAEGATLTINGPGTLNVRNRTVAAAGADTDETSSSKGRGEDGYLGIAGNVVVNGGMVNVTGGTGGTGGANGNGRHGGEGGTGGAGIGGSLTVNGGTVTITGGEGGWGGEARGDDGKVDGEGGDGGKGGKGISGSLNVTGGTVAINAGEGGRGGSGSSHGEPGITGEALGSTVTCTASHGIQERNDRGTWSYLASGSSSKKNYVRVVENTPLSLYDNADNTSAIATAADDGMPCTVTLSGRTLYRDGAWNTLCLPFDLTLSGSTLDADGMDVRTLSTSDFSGGTLTLTFSDAGAVSTIESGKPYIIRWSKPDGYTAEGGFDITDPVFPGVMVKSGTTAKATDYVTFCGNFAPVDIYADPATKLYLGDDDELYWPSTEDFAVNAFRAYFQLADGLTCGDPASDDPEHGGAHRFVRDFRLGFGGETTGIDTVTEDSGHRATSPELLNSSGYYTLDGRKLNGQPTRSGLYIHGGRKVVIP